MKHTTANPAIHQMPRIYYYRGALGISDQKWIKGIMEGIQVDNRYEVSREYERKYNNLGRKEANFWLSSEAKKQT